MKTVASLGDDAFLEKINGWSTRDIVAHLIGWNRYVIEGSRQIRKGELPFYDEDPGDDYSKVNAVLVREYASRDKRELLQQLEESASELGSFLGTLEEDEWARDFGVVHRGATVTIRSTVDELIDDYDHHRRQIQNAAVARAAGVTEFRDEAEGDAEAIRAVHEKAFGQAEEADIVDALRKNCQELISLVALRDGALVGHALFSPAVIETAAGRVTGMGLAPVAVTPEQQGRGIGSELIRRGLERIRATACPFVIVLGHAEYYPRFGFERASLRGIRSEWDVPDEAFMVLVVDPAAMADVSGVAKYRPELGGTM